MVRPTITRVGAEPRAPRAIADHGDVPFVGRHETPELRACADDRQQRRSHAQHLDHALIFLALDADAHDERQRVVERLERPRHALEIVEVGGGEWVGLVGQARVLAPQHGEPLRVVVGQRPQQHAVHHGEDGAVGAEPEAQGHDGQRGEGARRGQTPCGGANVVQQRIPHGGSSPRESVEMRTMCAPGVAAHGGAPFGESRGRGTHEEHRATAARHAHGPRRGVAPAIGEGGAEVGAELRAKARRVGVESSAQEEGQRMGWHDRCALRPAGWRPGRVRPGE